jgi:crossover junction endodeoxyribonuclease RusA
MTGPRHISQILKEVIDTIEKKSESGSSPGRPRAPLSSYNAGTGSTCGRNAPHKFSEENKNMSLMLELPFPPSVNTYWGIRTIGSGKKKFVQRYINDAGKKFRQAVLDHCLVENITQKFDGPLACTVDLFPPCNRRRDCDNFCKGLLDALGHAGIYDDDSQIIDLHIRMHPKRPPGAVLVTLESTVAQHSGHNQMGMAL